MISQKKEDNKLDMEKPNTTIIQSARYIETIIRQWWLVVVSTILFGIGALLVSISLPKQYEASVLIATTKVASSVSFGSSIETTSEEQLLAAGGGAIDRQARLESYVQMVKNPDVAQSILDQYRERLDTDVQDVRSLLNMVDGSLAGRSDSIKILVRYKNPVLATDIANAWGQAYVEQVNSIYSEAGTRVTYTAIKNQVADAGLAYEAAQAKLEDSMKEIRLDELTRNINERQAVLDDLSFAYTHVISSVVSIQAQATLKSYIENIDDLQIKLEKVYQQQRTLDKYLADARSMLDQVIAGGDGAVNTNTLALSLLKIQVFSSEGDLGNLQFQTSQANLSSDAMQSDLEGLISVLQTRREELDKELHEVSGQLLDNQAIFSNGSPLNNNSQAIANMFSNILSVQGLFNQPVTDSPSQDRIQELEQEVRDLKAQLEEDSGRLQEAVRARDLAWETYLSLATKEAELRVSEQTKGTAVALAVPAAVPDEDEISIVKNVSIFTIIGLVLGIISSYAIEFWWTYKGISPHPVIRIPRLANRDRE
jgi:uncharacterized protein involved in exopolysaccharide biosynthesis